MKTVKLTKQFDDYVKGARMTSYSPTGGDKGDGVYEVVEAVADRMALAGAIEGGSKPPASAVVTGGSTPVAAK